MRTGVFRYEGKRAIVVGGATGFGAAAARAAADPGGDLTVLTQIADSEFTGTRTITVDLGDRGTLMAVATELGGPIHAVFSDRKSDLPHEGGQSRLADPHLASLAPAPQPR